jgi:hypothetical protein
MAVTPFIPLPRPGRFAVKSHAVLAFPPVDRRRAAPAGVTASRPAPVGWPTTGGAAAPDHHVGSLVAEAITAGRESLDLLEERARQAARACRWRRDTTGRDALAAVVDGLQAVVQLAAAAADAVGLDLDALCMHCGVDVLAGTIEQDLLAVLSDWRLVLDLLGSGPLGPSTPDPGGFAA